MDAYNLHWLINFEERKAEQANRGSKLESVIAFTKRSREDQYQRHMS